MGIRNEGGITMRKTTTSSPKKSNPDGIVLKKPRRMTSRRKDTMTPREISFESGLGLETVYDEIQKRRLACMKVGNRHIVSRVAYNRWLATMGGQAA